MILDCIWTQRCFLKPSRLVNWKTTHLWSYFNVSGGLGSLKVNFTTNRPNSVVVSLNIDNVTFRKIMESFATTGCTVLSRLHEHFVAEQIFSCLVPHNFTIAQEISIAGIQRLKKNILMPLYMSLILLQVTNRVCMCKNPKVNSSYVF